MNKNGRKKRREIREAYRAIDVKDGDVILLRAGTQMADETFMNGLSVAMEKAGKPNCILVIVDDFNNLSILSEEAMAKHGWFRKNES